MTGVLVLRGNTARDDQFFYPTGQTGRYVKIDRDHQGRKFAQLVVGLTLDNPIHDHLEPVGLWGDRHARYWLTGETLLAHTRLIAAELNSIESEIRV